VLALSIVISPAQAGAQEFRPAAWTIVAREVSGWFYSDGRMSASEPEFEVVFDVRGSSVVRRTVKSIKSGKVLTDDTEYRFLTQLATYDTTALRFKVLTDQLRPLSPVVRAIGQPGADAIEILFIGPDWIQAVKTVDDYMVISRFRRLQ
jgi:hypothetical protein